MTKQPFVMHVVHCSAEELVLLLGFEGRASQLGAAEQLMLEVSHEVWQASVSVSCRFP